jgi:acyl-CoA dehydrogenase
MDITVPPAVSELARQAREFIAEVVIGVEEETGGSIHAAPDELRRSLQKQARAAGLLAPHVPVEWGGCGLDVRGQAVVFAEAIGRRVISQRRRAIEGGEPPRFRRFGAGPS